MNRLLSFCLISLVLAWPGALLEARDHWPGLSLDEAVEQVRQRGGERILSAQTQTIKGRRIHVIRVLSKKGRVHHIRLDAASGKRILPPSR